MHPALGRANQKLYHASILTRLFAAERERAEVPLSVLQDAVGEAARWHLRAAYGWLLVALADLDDVPAEPPASAESLLAGEPGEAARGELVELRALEASGWLGDLLAPGRPAPPKQAAGGAELRLVEAGGDEDQLRRWHDGIAELIDRMSQDLEES